MFSAGHPADSMLMTTSAGLPDDRDGPCGRYVVVVVDLEVDEIDAYGPMSWSAAQRYASRVRVDLDTSGISGTTITVVILTASPPDLPG